jgi:hypothetical protein
MCTYIHTHILQLCAIVGGVFSVACIKYIHTYMHTYILQLLLEEFSLLSASNTYIHMHTYILQLCAIVGGVFSVACIKYIHTYMHTYISQLLLEEFSLLSASNTYIHTYIHTYILQLCAIVGGVFTVAGILASVIDKGITSLKRKEELGKLG